MPKNERLQQQRIARSWRQYDLADQLGTTVTTIQRWERGFQEPSTYYRTKLCDLFGLSAEELGLAEAEAAPAAFPRMDWIGALDVDNFVGREVEVAELSQWIVLEHCRLVAVLGMGGIGKSMLASFLGQHLASHFEVVLWRSVRDAPSCDDLVAECLTFCSETPPASLPPSLEQRLNLLLTRLLERRCLLVLDNLETLLASGDREGNYLPDYEGYGRMIQRLAESAHQSCVLLTSREKPKELGSLEGRQGPVRSLRLTGVDAQAAQDLLADKELRGNLEAWQQLVTSYAGNPLALKIVGQAISDLFGGDIERFLQDGALMFHGIRAVLRQQIGRLTALEQSLLTWLAVLREWTSLEALLQVLHPRALRARIMEALEALSRRSLLEQGQQASFGLQSVVMEYLTDELGERLSEEIVRGDPQLLRSYALEQAQAKDYIRQTQLRLLVQPLLERLRSELGAEALIETHLQRLLARFRSEDATTQGYGPANVISLLKTLRGHLRSLDLSRLSIHGAYLQEVEMQDVTLAGATLRDVVFTEAFDAILCVAVSPDGRYVAAGSNSGQVRVWSEEGRVAYLILQGNTDRVGAIAFSSDGQALAAASWDGTIRFWDLASGVLIWTFQDHQVPLTALALGSHEQLISGSRDGSLHFWDLRTGTKRASFPTPDSRILAIALSQDGRLLASGGMDGVVRLWNVEQRTLLQECRGHRDQINQLVFAPDTSLLASGSNDQTVRLWDVETGTCQTALEGHTGPVTGLAWTPDGRTLASASYDTTIRHWDCQTWQCRHILQRHSDAVSSLAFMPTGEQFVSGGFDKTIRTWEVMSGQNVRTMYGYALALFALAWSPDGHFLVSGSSDATLIRWDVATRTLVQVLRGHHQLVKAVGWSGAGNRLASGSADQTVCLWDAETGACARILRGHTATVSCVDWSPDGRFLASGGYDRIVRLWNMEQDTSRVGGEHAGLIYAVKWSPDGTRVASAGEDGRVCIWQARDSTLLRTFEHPGSVIALAWSPNGEQVVSGAMDGEQGILSIWDVPQDRRLRTLEGHRGFVMGVEWSSEEQILVSAGADGTVRWWHPEQGVQLAAVQAHDTWVRAVHLSPDGQTLASCGEDGIIQLWEMQSHQHLATLRAERPYERLDISEAHGLTDAQQAALRTLGAVSGGQATSP